MTLSTSDWIAVISIIVAIVIGVVTIVKKGDGKSNQVKVEQKSSALSKANQKQNVNVNISND